MKYYAVRAGRQIGIFRTWKETENLVKGFSSAKYKSFATEKEAKDYLNDKPVTNRIIPQKANGLQQITFYTDGSSKEGKSGWGFVQLKGDEITERCGSVLQHHFPDQYLTNDISEMVAVKEALSAIMIQKRSNVIIFSDSTYVVKTFNTWIHQWKKNDWKKASGGIPANLSLIQHIDYLRSFHDVEFHHVYAHRGNLYNERADILAKHGRELIN